MFWENGNKVLTFPIENIHLTAKEWLLERFRQVKDNIAKNIQLETDYSASLTSKRRRTQGDDKLPILTLNLTFRINWAPLG